jgi:hypothetical protein
LLNEMISSISFLPNEMMGAKRTLNGFISNKAYMACLLRN